MFNPPTVVDQLRRIAQSDAVSQARVAAVRAIKFVVRSRSAAVSLASVRRHRWLACISVLAHHMFACPSSAWVRSWSVFATMMLLCEQQRLTAYTRSSTLTSSWCGTCWWRRLERGSPLR